MTINNNKTAAIILNGLNLPKKIIGDYIICADGGYDLVERRDLLIGDFDSVKSFSDDKNLEIKRFDRDKNATDGELAIREAVSRGYKNVIVYGALGGRPDHVAANLNLLCLASALGSKARIISAFENSDQMCEIYFVKDSLTLNVKKDDVISILPRTSRARMLTSGGLKYPLDGLVFDKNTSLGISNIATESVISITVLRGSVFLYRIFDADNKK